jgi:hypothetical protein
MLFISNASQYLVTPKKIMKKCSFHPKLYVQKLLFSLKLTPEYINSYTAWIIEKLCKIERKITWHCAGCSVLSTEINGAKSSCRHYYDRLEIFSTGTLKGSVEWIRWILCYHWSQIFGLQIDSYILDWSLVE